MTRLNLLVRPRELGKGDYRRRKPRKITLKLINIMFNHIKRDGKD